MLQARQGDSIVRKVNEVDPENSIISEGLENSALTAALRPDPVRWQGSCEDCAHWVWDSQYGGHCGLQSCSCITAVAEYETPPNFLSWEDLKTRFETRDDDIWD